MIPIESLGDELYAALRGRHTIEPLSSRHPQLTIEQAYSIQERMMLRRRQDGERIVGKKIGVTSAAVMNMLGVAHLATHKAITLSGGERRRVEIARALVLSPFFLLLDEPFTGIDPIAVAEIQKIVRRLIGTGIGILITDHNVRETLGICDRAYIINEGTVLEEGTPEVISVSAKARKFYLGEGFRF